VSSVRKLSEAASVEPEARATAPAAAATQEQAQAANVSGSAAPSAEDLKAMAPLINAPERASTSQRALSRVFTTLAWAAYMWLIAPLLTSLAWLLGVRSAWIELSRPLIEGTGTPGLLLPILAGIGAGLLLLWGEFNRWRFTGVERRKHTPPVTDAVVAKALGAPPDLADRVRKSFQELPVIVLQMNEQAEPEGFVATMEPPKALRRIMK